MQDKCLFYLLNDLNLFRCVVKNEVSVKRCATSNMVADLFTKGLPRVTFEKHWEVARGQCKPGNLSLGAIAALTRRACAAKTK